MWRLVKIYRIDISVIKFFIVGIGNTFFGLLVIFLSKWLLAMGDVAANALGYGCGLILSFVLNKRWTFQHSGSMWIALIKFMFVVATAYSVNLIVVLKCIHNLGVNSYVAQAVGIIPYTLIGYFGGRFYAFK